MPWCRNLSPPDASYATCVGYTQTALRLTMHPDLQEQLRSIKKELGPGDGRQERTRAEAHSLRAKPSC